MELFLGIIIILIAHYVADFIFQPREMAKKKSESVLLLSIHTVIYSMIFFLLFCAGGMILDIFYQLPMEFNRWATIGVGITTVNGILHYIIDYFTSKANKYFWQRKDFRKFFLMIGFDQLLHLSLLVYSYAEMLDNFLLI